MMWGDGKIDLSRMKTPVERLRMSYLGLMKTWSGLALTAGTPEMREAPIQSALNAAEVGGRGRKAAGIALIVDLKEGWVLADCWLYCAVVLAEVEVAGIVVVEFGGRSGGGVSFFGSCHARLGLLFATTGDLPDGNDTVRDLRALALQTLEVAGWDRDEFLSELTTSIAKPELPTEVNDVRIMSLHKSKGLSSPVTIIAGCVQGLLPRVPDDDLSPAEHRAQMEEERRLFYVGITRVKAVPEEGKRGRLVHTYSRQMLMADAMKAGIQPAGRNYGDVLLIASQLIWESDLWRAAPRAG